MNSVEKVKAICKEKKIPISKLERDLGFGNGYVGQLKKGSFPDDRLLAIASYLNVTTDYLMGSEQKEKPIANSDEQLDTELIMRLCQLTPDEIQKVDAFVQGLLASR